MEPAVIREYITVNVVKDGVIVEQSLFLMPFARAECYERHRRVLASFIPESVGWTPEDWARVAERLHARGSDGTVVQMIAGELGNDYYSMARLMGR